MSKLFGDRPATVMAVVDPPVSQLYARKARVSFLVVLVVASVLVPFVLTAFTSVGWAVLVGVPVAGLLAVVTGVVVWAWPVLRALWHWALEIGVSVVVMVWLAVVGSFTTPLLAVGMLLAAAVTAAAVRPAREWVWVWAWTWCVVVRHRLRACFAQFIRSQNRQHPSLLPLVLTARPTPAGERVWLWFRPGMDLSDLDGRTGKVAVACWASEVRVVRASKRFAALVQVDVTRRDPLTGVVPSPLAALFAGLGGKPLVLPVVDAVGLDLDDVPEPTSEPASARRTTSR